MMENVHCYRMSQDNNSSNSSSSNTGTSTSYSGVPSSPPSLPPATMTRKRMRQQRKNHHPLDFVLRSVPLALQILVVGNLLLQGIDGLVDCTNDEICQNLLLRTGPINNVTSSSSSSSSSFRSKCIDGYCSNPYQNGCLINRKPGWTKPRMCHSEDPPNAAALGLCRLPQRYNHGDDGGDDHGGGEELEYIEIRIASQNWESVFFEAWILQILLSEILDVPTTIEIGLPLSDAGLNLYDPNTRMDYGRANQLDALVRGYNVSDCRLIPRDVPIEEYQSCYHVVTEMWSPHDATIQRLTDAGVIEPPSYIGVVGLETWMVPKFTGESDPTLLTYLGLSGEETRRKLAETFKRPTRWRDYCEQVSDDNCATDDGIAVRAPIDDTEYDRFFVEGLYIGHFRMTDENNCDLYPTNCTGHISDFPCDWTSNIIAQTYHLDIALSSSGREPVSGGYLYWEIAEIWRAAFATKSNVIQQWWLPEAMYQEFMGTDAELQTVALPPTNHQCSTERKRVSGRKCSTEYTLEEKVGDPIAACGDGPIPVTKLFSRRLYEDSYDPAVPEAKRSPSYDVINNFKFNGIQMGEIFDLWYSAGVDKWNLDARDATCRWVVENFEEVQRMVPRSYPRVIRENDDSHRLLTLITLSLGGVALFSSIICIGLTYYHRRSRVMIHAQVSFMALLLAGVLLVSMASIVQAVQPSHARCVSVIWLANVGYSLELVPMIVKIAAITSLMQAARRMKRAHLKRKKLFGLVAILTGIVAIFLLFWTLFDPPQERTIYTLTDSTTEEGDTVVLLDHFCHAGLSFVWRYTALAAQTCLLICASVLAFQTRKLRTDLNESQTVALMIYSHFVFVSCRVIASIFESSVGEKTVAQILSLVYSLDSLATLLIYFVPKFFADPESRNGANVFMFLTPGRRQSGLTPTPAEFEPTSSRLIMNSAYSNSSMHSLTSSRNVMKMGNEGQGSQIDLDIEDNNDDDGDCSGGGDDDDDDNLTSSAVLPSTTGNLNSIVEEKPLDTTLDPSKEKCDTATTATESLSSDPQPVVVGHKSCVGCGSGKFHCRCSDCGMFFKTD